MFGVTNNVRQTRKPNGKHPGGRPTDYKPEYCQRVKDFMGQGYSLTAFAGEIGSCRDSVYEWASKRPEFSDAVKAARAARVRALEKKLLSEGIAPACIIFALKNACADEWRQDQPPVSVTVNNEVSVVTSPEKATAQDLRKMAEKRGLLKTNGHLQ